MAAKILIVDDDKSLRAAVCGVIKNAGYVYFEASNGFDAIEIARRENPDVVILDIMMPGLDGFEVCERIREFNQNAGILILSAKADITDKKTGHRLGADDYLTKPFNWEELLIRVESLLRRRRIGAADSTNNESENVTAADKFITIGDLSIHTMLRQVTFKGERVELTMHEFDILATLASQPGHIFTSDDIISIVWGPEYLGGSISIPVYIRHIRKKIEPDPTRPIYIRTVRHLGYQLVDPTKD